MGSSQQPLSPVGGGTSSPKVSIVIPVFNTGRYLKKALRSATCQTYRDREVIVVDDGSTDATTRAILASAEARPGVTVLCTPNRGPARARNFGIEHSHGTYILPLDADDWLAPTFLEKTVPVLNAEPEVGVVFTWIGLAGRQHGTWRTGQFSLTELLTRCTIHVCSLYRREIWVQVGGYDPRFAEAFEDWDFWLSVATKRWQARCIPEVLAYYRRLPTGREISARGPDVKHRLVRSLVSKHRAAYDANLEHALAGMYDRLELAISSLERIYNFPPVRLFVWLRYLFSQSG